MAETLIKTRYRVIMPSRCPTCGALVPSVFDHIDRECSTEDPREPGIREVMWPREPGYDRLRALIEPLLGDRSLEHVSVLADFKGGTDYAAADMFVDETGALNGLPINDAATTIYRRYSVLTHRADPDGLPAIYGVAILFERRVWF